MLSTHCSYTPELNHGRVTTIMYIAAQVHELWSFVLKSAGLQLTPVCTSSYKQLPKMLASNAVLPAAG